MSTTSSTLQLPVVPTGVKKLQCPTPVSQVTGRKFSKCLKEPERNDSFSRPCGEGPSRGYIDKGDSPIKKAGNFLLGPEQGGSPVKCMQQFLARKDGTDEFYILKILTLKDAGEKETTDDIQGKTLLDTEHSLLSLLRNEEGVVHEHGMFRETVREKVANENGEVTIKDVIRQCLVLDCYVGHDFSQEYSNVTNMQCYVIGKKKLPESEALRIFCKVVEIVERLHKLNIVHKDLKLANIILDKGSRKVTLANICLGKHLSSENELLKDQRGSPAYMSPDVINGEPFLGKPTDMWALGIVLYTMLFGSFPFYHQSPIELLRRIKLGNFQIPVDVKVSQKTVALIRSLLVSDPKKRLTASQTLEKVRSAISPEQSLTSESDLQVVPDGHPGAERSMKRTYSKPQSSPTNFVDDINHIFTKCEESTDIKDFEPLRKRVKLGVSSKQFDGLIRQYTLDDQQLQRLHAMLVARKITEAASLGKLNAQMITEELANQLSSGLIKSATTTNTDSARVPEVSIGIANTMSPATSAVGLGGNIKLNGRAFSKNKANNGIYLFP